MAMFRYRSEQFFVPGLSVSKTQAFKSKCSGVVIRLQPAKIAYDAINSGLPEKGTVPPQKARVREHPEYPPQKRKCASTPNRSFVGWVKVFFFYPCWHWALTNIIKNFMIKKTTGPVKFTGYQVDLRLLLSFCFLIFSIFLASGLSFPSNLFSSSSHICFLA